MSLFFQGIVIRTSPGPVLLYMSKKQEVEVGERELEGFLTL